VARHDTVVTAGLQWLRVTCFPPSILFRVLSAHHPSPVGNSAWQPENLSASSEKPVVRGIVRIFVSSSISLPNPCHTTLKRLPLTPIEGRRHSHASAIYAFRRPLQTPALPWRSPINHSHKCTIRVGDCGSAKRALAVACYMMARALRSNVRNGHTFPICILRDPFYILDSAVRMISLPWRLRPFPKRIFTLASYGVFPCTPHVVL